MKRWIVRRRAGWLGAAVVAAAVGGWTAHALRRETRIEVVTAAVTRGAIVRRIIATGTLQAVTTVQVGAQVSGTIQALYADYNSIVHKGETLARLDPALFDAGLRESEAALAQAQAARNGFQVALEDAATKLARAEALAARELIARSDLDAARIAMDQAAAGLRDGDSQVEQARAAVNQARVALDHTIIYSPIDGIVVARSVDVGQTVAAALQAPVLFNIAADLRRMQIEIDVDESDIAGIERGERVTFEVESYPGQLFDGTVSQVRIQPVAEQTATASTPGAPAQGGGGGSSSGSATVATVVSYATMVDVANPDEKLRPGMTATVHLNGTRVGGAVRIPNSALSFRPAEPVLEAAGEKADLRARPVEAAAAGVDREIWRYDGTRLIPVGVRVGVTDGTWTELVAGALQEGDALIVSAELK